MQFHQRERSILELAGPKASIHWYLPTRSVGEIAVALLVIYMLHRSAALGHQQGDDDDPPTPPAPTTATATGRSTMLVFGDSTVDPGNNNRLQTAAKANFLPYGVSFYGGMPTGSFSNGRLVTDILGTYICLNALHRFFFSLKRS